MTGDHHTDRHEQHGTSAVLLGFEWGPLKVSRLAHVEGRGYTLEIGTEHQSMQVYVSEKGRNIEAMPVRSRRGRRV